MDFHNRIQGLRLSFKLKNRRNSDRTPDIKEEPSIEDDESKNNPAFRNYENFTPSNTSTMKKLCSARDASEAILTTKNTSSSHLTSSSETTSSTDYTSSSDDVFTAESRPRSASSSSTSSVTSVDSGFFPATDPRRDSNSLSYNSSNSGLFPAASSRRSSISSSSSNSRLYPATSSRRSSIGSNSSNSVSFPATSSRRASVGSNSSATSLRRTPAFLLKRRPSDILQKFSVEDRDDLLDTTTAPDSKPQTTTTGPADPASKPVTAIRKVPCTNPYIRAGARLSSISSTYEMLVRKEPTPPRPRRKMPLTSTTARLARQPRLKFTVDLSDSIHI